MWVGAASSLRVVTSVHEPALHGAAEPRVHLQRKVPGAVSAGVRVLEGNRRVVWVEFDDSVHKGALSSAASQVLSNAANTARDKRLPLVMSIASSGADILEGVAALDGWGQAARAISQCSGVVPSIAIVHGPAVSGPALLIGLCDLVIMTSDSYAFVSGPTMVAQMTGIEVSNEELGGTDIHARESGVASLVASDTQHAHALLDEVLRYLPSHVDELTPMIETGDPVNRLCDELNTILPASSTGSYDVRKVIESIADDGIYLELRAGWAGNIVTALASIGGHSVGIVANQPLALAGTLDIQASQKAARFVAFCDAFNISIVTLVDTPGFYPGKDLEWRGMIRHGAQLVFAYGRATVPRVCVILRKSYGGAYIVMDSKRMGNDICLAWPTAELAVMGAGQAAAILQRRATPDERAEFERDYEERLLNPYVAAERGYVDAVIAPADTRTEVLAALDMLSSKREKFPKRKHDNGPL
jgi:acetyl-CoA carboxylase carboxyltransferase component